MNKLTKFGTFFFVALLTFWSCAEDDDVNDLTVVASFQHEVDEENFLKVSFTNFSQNAVEYSWDFGDGSETTTEENPEHIFPESGVYVVTLTAIGADGTSVDREEDVTITDPDQQLTLLAGTDNKTWKLLRDGAAMGVGPNAALWYDYWTLENNGERNCLYVDEFTFHRNGDFAYNDNGSFWGEEDAWPEGNPNRVTCFDSTPDNMIIDGDDVSAWGSGTHAYVYDVDNNRITLNGTGAWIGLPKLGTNGGVTRPTESVTFQARLRDGGASGVDTMYVEFDHGDLFWRINYVSYSNPADEPALEGPRPVASFAYTVDVETRTVEFTNNSSNATSYSWDFGDGNTASSENPTHQYAENGIYTVSLTATNENGSTQSVQDVAIGASNPTAEDLHGGSEKVWKLKQVAGAIRVGPSIGSGEWFATSVADIEDRACQFDDEFIFKSGGDYAYDAKGEVYAEPYMGVDPAACVDEGSIAAPFSGFTSNDSFTFSFTEATDTDRAVITVNGVGAFIGFNKAFNGGEYGGDESELKSSISYQVLSYINDGNSETLEISVDISEGEAGGAWWSMTLVSE